MDHSNNNDLESASFDTMNELLIPTQTVNAVTPLIPAISNNAINTSTQSTTNEHDDLSDCKNARNNVANSNADFDLSIDDSSDFIDITEKKWHYCETYSRNI